MGKKYLLYLMLKKSLFFLSLSIKLEIRIRFFFLNHSTIYAHFTFFKYLQSTCNIFRVIATENCVPGVNIQNVSFYLNIKLKHLIFFF